MASNLVPTGLVRLVYYILITILAMIEAILITITTEGARFNEAPSFRESQIYVLLIALSWLTFVMSLILLIGYQLGANWMNMLWVEFAYHIYIAPAWLILAGIQGGLFVFPFASQDPPAEIMRFFKLIRAVCAIGLLIGTLGFLYLGFLSFLAVRRVGRDGPAGWVSHISEESSTSEAES